MKKRLILICVAIGVIGVVAFLPVVPTSAQGTKFPANMGSLNNPFVITSVQPSTNKLKIRYNGEFGNVQPLSLINIQAVNEKVGSTEARVDDLWSGTGSGKPYWTSMVYYEKAASTSEDLGYGAEEQELTRSQSPMDVDFDEANLHLLYYSILPGTIVSTRYLTGKIDYTLCMKSAVYKPGVECRAENKPQGGLWYWPYYEGEKLKIPREEWDAWGYSEDDPQPQPEPEPIPVPQSAEMNHTDTQVQHRNETISRTVIATQTSGESTQKQSDSNTAPQSIRETVEVPVSGDACPSQDFPWWILILWAISLGIEGVILYWWFRRRQS